MIDTLADKLNRLLEDENRSKGASEDKSKHVQGSAAHIKSIRSESSEKDRSLISEIQLG